MAVVLALVSAASFGVGDFLGGMATKRAPVTAVLFWSHVAGLALVGAAVAGLGGVAAGGDVALGALGGLAGAAGVGMLYRGLAIGPMSAVAPVTALLAAAVPVVAGFVQGERPGVAGLVGMAGALAATVLVSAEGGGSYRPADLRGVALALGAGTCFGMFFVVLSFTGDDSGLWPLLGARAASVGVLGLLVASGRLDGAVPAGHPRRLTLGAGVLDIGANVLYLLAIREGLLSVVSVLSSLYPVSTVVLARIVLGERYLPAQRLGMAVAVPAAILLAI